MTTGILEQLTDLRKKNRSFVMKSIDNVSAGILSLSFPVAYAATLATTYYGVNSPDFSIVHDFALGNTSALLFMYPFSLLVAKDLIKGDDKFLMELRIR